MRLLSSALGVAVITTPLAGQAVRYEGGVSVLSGAYIFTERTTSWTMYNGLALSAGPLIARWSVPVYFQDTKLLTVSGTVPLPTGGPASEAVRDSSMSRRGDGRSGSGMSSARSPARSMTRGPVDHDGRHGPVEVPPSAVTGFEVALGDPTASVGVTLNAGRRTSATFVATVKVPVTDTTDFGTGEWDVGSTLSLSHNMGISTLVGLDVSYWHLGDLPDLDLRNPVQVSASIAYLSRSGWGASASVSGARSIIQGFDDTYLVGAGVTRLGDKGGWGVTASIGLTDTAPDLAIGLSWRVRLLGPTR